MTLDDRTKDITDMVPVNTFGMNMARTFEYIDESK